MICRALSAAPTDRFEIGSARITISARNTRARNSVEATLFIVKGLQQRTTYGRLRRPERGDESSPQDRRDKDQDRRQGKHILEAQPGHVMPDHVEDVVQVDRPERAAE